MNEKTTLFDNKEHYFKFRQQWKDFINSGKANKKREKSRDWTGNEITLVTPSPLSSEYHLFYALAIGNGTSGFAPRSEGLDDAVKKLQYYMNIDNLKKVFGDTINEDFVKNVQKML